MKRFFFARARRCALFTVVVMASSAAQAVEWKSSAAYIQDGLVSQYDAIDNVGVGQHSNSTTKWRNLVTGADTDCETFSSCADSWTDKAYKFGSQNSRFRFAPSGLGAIWTLQFLMSDNTGTMIDTSDDGLWLPWGTSNNSKFTWRNGTRIGLPKWTAQETLTACSASGWYGLHQPSAGWSKQTHTLTTQKQTAWVVAGGYGGDYPTSGAKYHAIRVYNRTLTDDELRHNAEVDRYRFFDDASGILYVSPVDPVVYRGSHGTYEPVPSVVSNVLTGALLQRDVDYTVSWTNNHAIGTAQVVLTCYGDLAGLTAKKGFVILDPAGAKPTAPGSVPSVSGYIPLSSVRSDGAQHINIGLTPGTTTTLQMHFNTGPMQNDTTFFGQGWGGNQYLFIKQSDYYRFYGGGGQVGTRHDNTDCTVTIDSSNTFTMDWGGLYTADVTKNVSRSSSGNTWRLFAQDNGGRCGTWTFYWMKIWQSDVLKRDFWPVLRSSDNVAGIYDTVNNKFYKSEGSRAFIAGSSLYTSTMAAEELPCQILQEGGAARPEPVVYAITDTAKTTPLVKNVDYRLSWDDNEAPGTGYVTITGLGDYSGGVTVVAFELSHSMYDYYDTVEYLQSDGSQRINTGQYDSALHRLRGNQTFHIRWRQAWLGYFTNGDIGWGCTVDNNNWEYSVKAGGRRNTSSNIGNTFDNCYIYPYFRSNNRGMRPSDWNTTVIPNTKVIFEEKCKVDNKIVVTMKNTTSGIVYSTDPSIDAKDGTNFVSKAPICLFGDYYNNEGLGKKAIYGCKLVNDLTGEVVWELVPAIRLKDGKPGMYDMARNEFYTDNAGGKPFVCGPVTGPFTTPTNVYVMVDNKPVDPVAETCVNRQTGVEYYHGTDYEYVISNNAAPGTARIHFRGIGNFEGRDGFSDFTIVDGGTSHAERYRRLSRAYVRTGLCALYDGVDNAGTGVHDPSTIVWKDLGPYGLDATVGVCSAWADASCLRSTNGTYAAGVCPVITPLALAKTYVPPSDVNYTMEMRFRGNRRFQSHEPFLYDRYADGSNQQFMQWRNYYTRWYCIGSGRSTYDWTGGPWLKPDEVNTFSVQVTARGFRVYYDPDNSMGNDNVNWTYVGPSTQPITFGGRRNDATHTFVGDFHAIRVYQKALTQNEMRYNRAIDKVRYEGASLVNVLPARLPAGYSYDRTNDMICVNVCANALTAEGHVRINGQSDLAKITNMVVELGTVLTVEYVPKRGETLTKWFDLPGKEGLDWAYPDLANTNVVRITAWGPVSVGAVSPLTASGATLPARTYVPDGLVGLWDGIDNANEGYNRTGYPDWKDLTGKADRWWKYYGADLSNGRRMDQGRSTFYYTAQFPEYKSIELVYMHTGNESGYGGMIFVRKNDYNRTVKSHLGLKGVSGQTGTSYWPTPFCVSDYITSDRINTVCNVLHNPGAGGKIFCDETFYINGGLRGVQRGNYNDDNVTGYNYSYISGADTQSSNHRTCSGQFHAMRIYDRELTTVEASFNAAVDRVRYFGAAPEDVFPYIAIPDGYRWNASEKCLEVRLTSGTATGGTLAPAPGTVSWHAVGSAVSFTFTPAAEEQTFFFEGLPTNAEMSDEGRTATFKIACPTTVSAVMQQVFPARSYVSDGLYNLWDAIDNVDKGVENHSDASMKWYDLCGNSTYPWELVTGRGRFTKNALQCVSMYNLNHAASLPNLIRPYRTLEVAATGTWPEDTWRHILWNRDVRQTLHINASPSVHAISARHHGPAYSEPCFAATNILANVPNTYTALYATNCDDIAGYALNGVAGASNYTLPAGSMGWWCYNATYGGDGSSADDSQRKFPTLGSRYHRDNSSAGPKFFGEINVIRCYGRALEPHEIAFNAAMDRVRFRGARAKDEFPKLFRLPDGYRWNNTKQILEVLVSCSVSNGLGKVSLNGATAAKSASGYFPCGETVAFTAVPDDGRIVRAWHGITGHTYADADCATVTFAAASPVRIVVETVPAAGLVPFSTYVQDGLINCWDALEKPGDDRAWIDMKENCQMSLASGSIRWMGHALRFDGQSYLSGYASSMRQAIKDKSVTVQLFLRPLSYTYDGGYFSQGDGKRYRTLMLGMQGQQWVGPLNWNVPAKYSVYGAFGMLYYCCNTGNEDWWRIYHPDGRNFVDGRTDMYFGRDTLVTITRDTDGIARLYLNDNNRILSNDYKATSDETWEYTCFGAFYGGRCAHFDLYAFRVYDRVLTAGEVTVNNSVDRLRFAGDTSALPAGMKFEGGKLYSHFVAYADDPSTGGVAFTNGTAGASAEVWGEVGTTLSVAFRPAAGHAAESWSNPPPAAVSSGPGDKLVFKVSTPVTNIVARAKKVEGVSDAYFTSTHALPNLADTKKTVGNRTMYWFTNLTSETVYMTAAQDLTIEAGLVVGGGGAGGNYAGGGGGGGGVVEIDRPLFVPKGGVICYKVGKGAARDSVGWHRGPNGAATTFGASDFSATAWGGSGGGGHDSRGSATSSGTIGSGGGCCRGNGTSIRDGITYTASQGFWGGSSTADSASGGGGGGADGPGWGNAATPNGGPGRLTFLTGQEDQFGSGGGGGGWSGSQFGTAGRHAGNGGKPSAAGVEAVQGYGGGGGGGGVNQYGRGGGSGCVILSIRAGNTATKPLTVTLASSNLVWTGSALTTAVTVKDWNGNTVSSGNYTLTWFNNTNVGRGCVRVNGTGGTVAGLTGEAWFMIYKVFYASPSGSDSNTGLGWSSPKTLAGAVTLASADENCNIYSRPEVRCLAGTYALTAQQSVSRRIALRGGYSGSGETLAADPVSVINGQNKMDYALVFNASAERGAFIPCVLQRFLIKNGNYRAFTRSAGTGNMDILDCQFRNPGQYNATLYGRGMYAESGYRFSRLNLVNCAIEGNVRNAANDNPFYGSGAYFKNWGRVTMDNCTFITNGINWTVDIRSYEHRGNAFTAEGSPVVCRNCRFVGNLGRGSNYGSTIHMFGNCGGSAFSNCTFVGNCEYPPSGNWDQRTRQAGVFFVNMASGAQTLDLVNCTFAYNILGHWDDNAANGSAAAVTVYSGTVNAKNSIFWNNSVTTDSGFGTEVHVSTGRGHFNADWCLFGSRGTSYLTYNDGGTVSLGGHCLIGEDPLFVTPLDSVKGLLNSGTLTIPKTSVGRTGFFWKRTLATRAAIASIDVHLRTPEVSGGAVSYDELSPAIDAGDPADDFSKEPGLNGGRINLGAYGNTAEAEQTPKPGAVQCGGSVEFRNGESEPVANLNLFTLPATIFSGEVTVYCGTDPTFATYDTVRTFTLRSGTPTPLPLGYGYAAGTKVHVKVVARVGGEEKGVWTYEATAEGELPAWFRSDGTSHGGDSNKVIHVRTASLKPNGKGTSWEDAITDLYSAITMLDDTKDEIWFCGEQKLEKDPGQINLTRKACVRGGFTGCEDSAAERAPGARATVDGQKKAYCFIFTNTKEFTLDGITFTRGSSVGVRKRASAGDLIVTNCAFTCSGSTARWGADTGGGYDWSYEGGGGANFIGTAAATLYVYDSDFSGNTTINYAHSGSGGGAAIATWKQVYMDHCNFDTNQPLSYARGHAVALHFYNAPFEMTRTRFRGNYIRTYENNSGTCGSILAVIGNCGGSVIRSCVFSGNTLYDSMSRGVAYVYLGSVELPITVENVTFGYNLCGPAAALGIGRGTATVKNSIFYGNSASSGGTADLYCYDAGHAAVTYSMFAGQGSVYWGSVNNDQLSVDRDTCYFADPLFVSDTNAFMIATGNAAGFPTYTAGKDFTSRKAGLLLDVHLRSHGGTTLDDGTVRSYEDLCSPGVDAAEKGCDILDEPYPNGDRRNLGGYGGTPEAAYTPTGRAAIADAVKWTRQNEYSQPTVYFTLGGEGFYIASATLSVSVNGGRYWTELKEFTGLAKGDTLVYEVPKSFDPGEVLCFKVDLTASGETVTVTSAPKRVWGELPFGYGKGGDKTRIIHLSAAATGKGTGDSWWDAVNTLDQAFALVTAERNEIWIAGTVRVPQDCIAQVFPSPLTIRGGFQGDESKPDERPGIVSACSAYFAPETLTNGMCSCGTAQPFAWLDGENTGQILSFSNSGKVTVERVAFTRAKTRALSKTGGMGDLTLKSCLFVTNATTSGADGKGVFVEANSSVKVLFDDCVFDYNRSIDKYVSAGHGSGARVNACALLTVTNCVFTRNGSMFFKSGDYANSGYALQSGFQGHALYSASRVDIYGTRFVSNFGGARNQSDHGGCLVITGSAVGGSKVRNCVFAGNTDITTWHNQDSSWAGAIVFRPGVATASCLIDHCTFAYNLEDTKGYSAVLNVRSGVVTLRNSIFWSNYLSPVSATAAIDVYVHNDATLDLADVTFGAKGGKAIGVNTTGHTNNCANLRFGFDPGLVSATNQITPFITWRATDNSWKNYRHWQQTEACYRALLNLNVHLKNLQGYRDEFSRADRRVLGEASPAIDAADPSAPYALEPHPNGNRANLGAYGNTPWATRSRGGGRVIFRSRGD